MRSGRPGLVSALRSRGSARYVDVLTVSPSGGETMPRMSGASGCYLRNAGGRPSFERISSEEYPEFPLSGKAGHGELVLPFEGHRRSGGDNGESVMELKDLDSKERLVLVAALRFTVFSDGKVSREEAGQLDEVVAALGEDSYRKTIDEAEDEIRDVRAFDQAVAGVTRPEAQELIYEWTLKTAISDSIRESENRILDRLATAWNIKVEEVRGEESKDGSS